jgi:hypothetical protein
MDILIKDVRVATTMTAFTPDRVRGEALARLVEKWLLKKYSVVCEVEVIN